MNHVWSIILAGGIGSRFWPVSRAARPKQLLDLFGEGPMLRVTLERARPLAPPERTIVVTSEALAPTIQALLPDVPAAQILAEPCGRNTAPAIAWAALVALAHDPDAVLMVLPADHHIVDVPAYRAACARALALATEGRIVTLGVPPTHPETGYGYIRRAAPIPGPGGDSGAFEVDAFVEKPDLATAIGYLAAGGYDWNAGMFFMRAQVLLDELALHRPDLHAAMVAAPDIARAFPSFPSVSIDYAVMEKSDRIAVLPGVFGWSDVGSWRSLWDHRADKSSDATSFSQGDVIELDGRGNVLFADGGLVCAVGVSDLIVVHTPDATFVCPREEAQRAKDAVVALTAAGRKDLL